MFRSAASGMWYENARAAGTIDAVKLHGHILERDPGESSLSWIKRVAEWAAPINEQYEPKEPQP